MKYRAFRKSILVLGDVFLLFVSLYFALSLRWQKIISPHLFLRFTRHCLWLFLFWLFLLFIFDFYSFELRKSKSEFFRYFFIFIFLSLFFGIFYFYFFSNLAIAPKTILFLNIFIFSLFFLLWHLFFEWIFKKSAQEEKIILWGNPPEKDYLIGFLSNSKLSYDVVGNFDEKVSLNKIKKIAKENKLTRIVISPEVKNFQELFFLVPIVKIQSFSDFYEEITKRVPLSSLQDPNVLNGFLFEENSIYYTSKRIFDLVISLIGVLVFFILFPILALAIKINSKGPVFFVQKRIGKGEKIFNSFKFRSMYVVNKSKDIWREKDKKEITAVGRFIRFTHIDELPQFLNILKGDLSIVGPRPEWEKLVKKYERAIPFYFLRHKAKPGFTGWAQINYPPSLSIKEAEEKLEYDLYYIKKRSFFFDLFIFLKSLRKIFG